jgi:hypothetical protein
MKDFRTMLKVLKTSFPPLFQILSVSEQLNFERNSMLESGSAESLLQVPQSFL